MSLLGHEYIDVRPLMVVMLISSKKSKYVSALLSWIPVKASGIFSNSSKNPTNRKQD